MPTYTVTNSNFNLSPKQQKNLAEGITKVHNQVTGANTYFAQVIFNKTKKNNHFIILIKFSFTQTSNLSIVCV